MLYTIVLMPLPVMISVYQLTVVLSSGWYTVSITCVLSVQTFSHTHTHIQANVVMFWG